MFKACLVLLFALWILWSPWTRPAVARSDGAIGWKKRIDRSDGGIEEMGRTQERIGRIGRSD